MRSTTSKTFALSAILALTTLVAGCQGTASGFHVDGKRIGSEPVTMSTYTQDEAIFRTNLGNFPFVLYKRVFEDKASGKTTFCLAGNFEAPTTVESLFDAFKKNGYVATGNTVIAAIPSIPTASDMDITLGRANAACFVTPLRYSSSRKTTSLFLAGGHVRLRE